jgi:DNA-binding transcriptional LysR family regulator
MDFVFVVPRSLLPQGRAEGLDRMLTLPFGMLRGDGRLLRGIEELARSYRIRLRTVFTAESFALLLESAGRGRFATVIPKQASTSLDENEWVVVGQGLESLSRELALIYDPNVAEMRSIVSRTASKMAEVINPR